MGSFRYPVADLLENVRHNYKGTILIIEKVEACVLVSSFVREIYIPDKKVLHNEGFCGIIFLIKVVQKQSIYQFNQNSDPNSQLKTEQTSRQYVLINFLSNWGGVACQNDKEALAIRRIFSLVDMITKAKFSNSPNEFKIRLFG